MVFFGEYQVSVTGGGRVVLPKKIREILNEDQFVITKGFNSCLAGYNKHDWERRAKELMSVSLLDKENLEKRRFLFSSAVYVETDEQGRFVLPKHLAAGISISSKVTIIGVGDHFELWNPDMWQTYLAEIAE